MPYRAHLIALADLYQIPVSTPLLRGSQRAVNVSLDTTARLARLSNDNRAWVSNLVRDLCSRPPALDAKRADTKAKARRLTPEVAVGNVAPDDTRSRSHLSVMATRIRGVATPWPCFADHLRGILGNSPPSVYPDCITTRAFSTRLSPAGILART